MVSDCFYIAYFLLSPSRFSLIYSIIYFYFFILLCFLVFFFFLSSSPIPVRMVSEWLCGAYLPTAVNPQQPYFVGLSYSSAEDSGIILVLMYSDLLICTRKKKKLCRCEYTGLCVKEGKELLKWILTKQSFSITSSFLFKSTLIAISSKRQNTFRGLFQSENKTPIFMELTLDSFKSKAALQAGYLPYIFIFFLSPFELLSIWNF